MSQPSRFILVGGTTFFKSEIAKAATFPGIPVGALNNPSIVPAEAR